MSTKIYNGYQIDSTMSAYSLMNLMVKLSKDCQEICNDLYHEEVAKFASLCLDTKLIFDEDEMNCEVYFKYKYSPSEYADSLYFYIEELVKQHSNSSSIFEDAFDFKCNLKLMPIKNKTLFMLYTEKKEYESIFGYVDKEEVEHPSEKYPKISPYVYYNNSDYPEHLTKEDWDNRREEWNQALREDENGFKYNLIKTPYIYNTNILTEKIEAMYEKRVQRLAFSKIKGDFNEANKHLIKGNDIGDFVDAFNKYSKTEEYKKDLEKVKEDIIKILPKTYTKEDFKTIKLTKITK